ncbi:MAG: GNAT family N-acetyltransferase [Candidatus Zixiibacteriota bacterium]
MTKAEVVVRAGTPDDYPAIAAVLDRTFCARPYEQRVKLWRWRSENNPVRLPEIPGFLIAELDGQIVGVHGLVPMRVKLGDRTVVASCSCDLAVDPSARSAGMKIKLKALSKELSALHISTSANEPANKITLALGGKEIAHGRKKLLKPLKLSGLLTRSLRAKAGSVGAAIGTILGVRADWPMALGRLLTRYPQSPGAEVHSITRFDKRFDQFWSVVSKQHHIMVVRDSAYLNWRYAEYPFGGISSFGLYRGESLLGFAVMHRSIDEDKLPFVALLELYVLPDEPEAYEQLLGFVVKQSVNGGAHYIATRCSTPKEEAILNRRGFRVRMMPFSPATYKNNTELPAAFFADDRNWYLTLGDGDGCYYYD